MCSYFIGSLVYTFISVSNKGFAINQSLTINTVGQGNLGMKGTALMDLKTQFYCGDQT